MNGTARSALDTAAAIARGELSAREVVQDSLEAIAVRNTALNCFTAVTAERALAKADAVDAARRRGETLGALAGVPYAVKNLYDVQGLVTLAGARLNSQRPPANADAVMVARLERANAILIGTTNMDAYAYGFTTENTHYGATRNPHDPQRIPGGSSGGSAAAVAAGLAHFALGSDTNGSIRVPASFCGLFGIKPTYGRLPRTGTLPFVDSLDHLGAFARDAHDLACIYDALQGADPGDSACAQRPVQPTLKELSKGIAGLKIAALGGHFRRWADDDAKDATSRVCRALATDYEVELHHADLARNSAFLITAAEAGERYLEQLRTQPQDFEPLSRERIVAGSMLPAAWYVRAQRFRTWFRSEASALFERFDLLIAPATPCVAPAIGTDSLMLGGQSIPWRPNVGALTQPISFIGLPVVSVPLRSASGMPIGVQLIAAPWKEELTLRAASHLQELGVTDATIASSMQ